MSVPVVSVVVPTYNAADTLLETIESVRRQTLSAIELIVIDDGSTDDTRRLLGTVHDPREIPPTDFEDSPAARELELKEK